MFPAMRERKVTSPRQRQILLEYMNLPEHKDLAMSTSWVRCKEGKVQCEEMWNELTSILNEEGTPRTAKQWNRIWVDIKSRVKKSVMFNRESVKRGSKAIKLSAMEQQVAAIMGYTNVKDEDKDHAVAKARKRRQTTLMQLHLLAKFMNDNLRVSIGTCRKLEDRLTHDKYYEQITKVLNKEGPARTPKEWNKIWVDMKCRVRSKLQKLSVNELDPSGRLSQLEELVAVIVSKNPQEESDDDSQHHEDDDQDEKEQNNVDVISTVDQLEVLWQYLDEHRDVATSAYEPHDDSHKAAWEEIALRLNAVEGGVVKDWKNWARFWTGYKNQLRSKVEGLPPAADADGDSAGAETLLDHTETRFLHILGDSFGSETCNESTSKRSLEDHSYSGTEQTNKKMRKTSNENHSDDDYFPENSHTNTTLHNSNSHTNYSILDLNSHTNVTIKNESQNYICTECHINQRVEDENDRNKSFLTLLSSELKFIPSCVKSDAFVNILSYVNSLKSKHKVSANSPPIYQSFDVLLNNTDPLG